MSRLLNEFEVGCGDPRIELHWPTLPFEGTLLIAFVGCSLPDHLLDQEPILCDFLHVRIPGNFELHTPFVDQLKYPAWGGLVALDQEVFVAPFGDVPLVERTFHFTDPHHLCRFRL